MSVINGKNYANHNYPVNINSPKTKRQNINGTSGTSNTLLNAQNTGAKNNDPAKAQFKTSEVIGIAAASALGAATIAGIAFAMSHRGANVRQQEAVRNAVNEAVSDTQQTLQETLQRLAAQEEANRAMKEVQEQLQSSLNKAQQDIRTKEEANNALDKLRKQLTRSLTEAQQRCESREQSNKALRQMQEQLQASLAEAQERCSGQEQINKTLQEMQDKLQASLLAAQERCNSQADVNKALTDMQNELMASLSDISNKYNSQLEANQTLENAQKGLQQALADIQKKYEGQTEANQNLHDIINSLNTKLAQRAETQIEPNSRTVQDPVDTIYEAIKKRLSGKGLNYDPTRPPASDKYAQKYADAVDLPAAQTTNRSYFKKLDIPEISPNGAFDYQLPETSAMKIIKEPRMSFTSVRKQPTTISENYADSVQWNNDKIARDLLQNFYDGHGQTLDGVRIISTPSRGIGDKKYKIRIEGKSTYTPDKALFIGESSKRDNAKAAGNYGEGLKMSVLKLLKDSGAPEVKIGSDNWKLTYELGNASLGKQRVMTYSLDKTLLGHSGNYIEFETTDKGLVEALRNSINRFYHSGNTDFSNPNFENDVLGIKILPKGQKGGFYIAGQKFEYKDDYDGLEGMICFIKEKPPVKVLDPSRDRISITEDKFSDIIAWAAGHKKTTRDDILALLNTVQPYWESVNYSDIKAGHRVRGCLMSNMKYNKAMENIHINFPEKYIAYSDASPELVDEIKSCGYTVCEDRFHIFGMKNIAEYMQECRAHKAFIPTETEEKKINIIKEALKSFTSLKDEHFTPAELDTKVFLFNAKAQNESEMTENAVAEAITNKGQSHGFWIDRDYLNKASFGDVLETALHELSHKAGGDETSKFSYKLTDVNSAVYQEILNNKETMSTLSALNRLWNELGQRAQAA